MNRHLTREEEPELWRRKQQGCEKARAQLIEAHWLLVPATVKRAVPNRPFSIDYEDLISEANIALIKAVDRYDPARGVKFASYAISLIRGAVIEYLRVEDWIPRTRRDKQKAARLRLATAESLSPGEEEALQRWAAVPTLYSLDDPALPGKEDESAPAALSVLSQIADPAPALDEAWCANEWRSALRTAVGCLPTEQRQCVAGRYFEQRTNGDLAQQRNLSESRIQQIHDGGLLNLRHFLARHAPEWFSDGR